MGGVAGGALIGVPLRGRFAQGSTSAAAEEDGEGARDLYTTGMALHSDIVKLSRCPEARSGTFNVDNFVPISNFFDIFSSRRAQQ